MPKIKKGKVITITSMKGGVGKTMLVLQLASVLKKIKKKILIVDFDLYNGDIAFALDIKSKGNVYNICDDIANNRYKSDFTYDYVTKYDDYIDVLSSPKDPRQASKISHKYLEILIKNFVHKYDVIIIDTNHILSATNMVAFENSDMIIDVFTNDAFDVKSTKIFSSLCKNMKVDNVLFVLNNALDDRKKYFGAYDIENIIKAKINFTIPKGFYIKNLDKYIIEGKTLEVCEKLFKSNSRDSLKFSSLALSLLEDKEDDSDEEK